MAGMPKYKHVMCPLIHILKSKSNTNLEDRWLQTSPGLMGKHKKMTRKQSSTKWLSTSRLGIQESAGKLALQVAASSLGISIWGAEWRAAERREQGSKQHEAGGRGRRVAKEEQAYFPF